MTFNKKIKTLSANYRPDICIHSNKTIIEFDGYRHYQTASVILSDRTRDSYFEKEGYEVIRIPYFVQLCDNVVNILFSHLMAAPVHIEQTYPHGFIDQKALIPADFCELGVEKFLNDLNAKFDSTIRNDILHSMKNRIIIDPREVFPVSMIGTLKIE